MIDVEGPGLAAATRLTFLRPYVLIGRDDRADLVFDHDAVSRRHAFLQVVEGRLFFVDLESRTGTLVDGVSAEAGWCEAGQALAVGPYTLRPVPLGDGAGWAPPPADPPRPNPLLARSSEGHDLPKVALEFQSRSSGHSIWRMNPLLALVGSSARCKVRLLDTNVSKLHCALVRTADGLWVVDLLGRGGITVNGASIRCARLNANDLLGLGQVTVRTSFEAAGADGSAVPIPWQPPTPTTPSFTRPAPAWSPPVPSEPLMPQSFPTNLPATFDPAGPAGALSQNEPALSLLLGHFGQMQQQMLDQFQQTMMMMVQMFGGMHREQMGLMREELDRLRELNSEMASIKAELAARPAGGFAPPKSQGASAIPMPPPGGPYHFGTGNRIVPNGHHPSPGSSSDDPPPAAPQAEAVPPLEPAADVHDWLNERLTAITTEQQNRWQRVMGMIRGGEK
ncbi:MAG: FHA domain-containing protein [Isosphaeraceae bacterium]